MVNAGTKMGQEFANCLDDGKLEVGDILVYRDNARGDGQAIMVIDPERRVAWGSHGWDGDALPLKVEPDSGIEYQLIKDKADWVRWGREMMRLQGCWRYHRFVEEAKTGRGKPGLKALQSACNPKLCRAAEDELGISAAGRDKRQSM
jgi:hypothetical protein